MIVLKFGGTSVGSAPAQRNVIEIVRTRLDKKPVVVVSALSGVTDMLYKASQGGEGLQDVIKELKDRHFSLIRELIQQDRRLCIQTQKDVETFIDFVEKTASSATELSDRDKAAIISTGELMSSVIVRAALCCNGIPAARIDARNFIIATGDPFKGEPDTDEINERTPDAVNGAFNGLTPEGERPQAVVTQGFICSSGSGKPALLGRGGSDYSASLIGRALEVEAVEIWTDVDGVRTADPRRVPTTRCLKRISYEEAAEMAHFGAKVLHPLTLEPAKTIDIPVYVLNTKNPDGECTAILSKDKVTEPVKSVSYKNNILVITLSPRQSMDTAGFIKRIFDIFSEYRIAVDLISTNNARVSITTDSCQKNLDKALEAAGEFAFACIDEGKAQISAIGSNAIVMNSILKMTFKPLRDSKIYMISPGASSVNISFVVDREKMDETLRETHKYLIENESCN